MQRKTLICRYRIPRLSVSDISMLSLPPCSGHHQVSGKVPLSERSVSVSSRTAQGHDLCGLIVPLAACNKAQSPEDKEERPYAFFPARHRPGSRPVHLSLLDQQDQRCSSHPSPVLVSCPDRRLCPVLQSQETLAFYPCSSPGSCLRMLPYGGSL